MLSRPRLTLATTFTLVSLAGTALADGPSPREAQASPGEAHDEPTLVTPEPAAAAPARTTEWYGWQTLASDAVSLGSIPLELSSASPSASYLFFASLSGYALGAPAIHVAHGHWRLAGEDLALRVGAVTVGSLLGAALGKPGTPSGCDGMRASCLPDNGNGLFVGATIGAVAAALLDASLLARDARPAETAPTPAFAWLPSASLVSGGATAGVGGTF